MKFISVFLAVVTLAPGALSVSIPTRGMVARAVPAFKVLRLPDGATKANDFFCTTDMIAQLGSAQTAAGSQAQEAESLLNFEDANTFEVVVTFLGTISTGDLLQQVLKRFTNTKDASSVTIEEVEDTTDGDDAVYYFCPDGTAASDVGCSATSDAITLNKNQGADFNQIALCPRFFSDTQSLDADVTAYQAANSPTNFPQPRNQGTVLLHEFQHSLPVLQSTTNTDNLQDRASTPQQCANLPTSAQKQTNAENWALLGFLAHADPPRFAPPPASPEPTSEPSSAEPSPQPTSEPSSAEPSPDPTQEPSTTNGQASPTPEPSSTAS